MPEFAFEGFDIVQLLGFGVTGEVYRARDLASGEVVALKRLRPEAMAVVERLRRDAAVTAEVGGRHVAVVREVVVTDTEVILVMAYAAGGNLAEVLSSRGSLDAGEAVTMLAPIASVVGRVHAVGAVHGNLTPTNILIAADGRPLLTDAGVALALGVDLAVNDATADFREPALFLGAAPSAASDVFSLGAIGFTALAGQPPRIGNDRLSRFRPAAPSLLVAAIEASIDPDPVARPTAAELGEALMAACRAEPLAPAGPPPGAGLAAATDSPAATRTLRLTGPLTPPPRSVTSEASAPPSRPRTTRLSAGGLAGSDPHAGQRIADGRPSRTSPARLTVGGIFAFGLVLLGTAGWGHLHRAASAPPAPGVVTRREPAPATTTPTPATSPSGLTSVAGWRGIVGYLDATRAQAFAAARPSLLRNVYLTGSPALAVDEASVRSLARRGLRAAGFTATVQRISVTTATQSAATLRVVDRLTAYRLVDRDGTTVSAGAARPARAYTMMLVRTPNGWRVSSILP